MLASLRRGAALLLACIVAAGASAVPASAGTASDDVLTVLGEARSFAGFAATAYPLTGSESVAVWSPAGPADVVYTRTSGMASIKVTAQPGRPRLTLGHHEANARDSDADVHVDVWVSGQTCSTGFPAPSPSSVTVLDLSRDATGRLTGLALDYAVVCYADIPPVRGSLRWNTDVPYALTTSTSFRAPDAGAGVTRRGSVTLTNAGTVPQTYGRSVWQPDTVAVESQVPVVVDGDGCAGVTLAPGGSCSVQLGVTSDGVRGVDGHLRTPDGTLRGAAYSSVTMRPVPTPERPTLFATSQRGAVRLRALPFDSTRYRVLRTAPGGTEVEIARDVTMPWTDTTATGGVTSTYRIVPVAGDADGPASDAVTLGPLPRPAGEHGTFVTVDPVRVLDTRDGTGAPVGAVGPGQTLRIDPAASGSIPSSGVAAVLLNLTGTQPTTVTHVRVWPAGDPRPETSSLNLVPGQSRPNQVVVPLGENGEIALYNNAGSTHLVADLQGYYSDVDGPHGGAYHPQGPGRTFDSRTLDDPLGAGETTWVPIGTSLDAWERMTAVEVNLTVTQPSAHGHLTAWAGNTAAPVVSNANFAPGQTVASHAVVPVSRDASGQPRIAVRNSAGATHVVVDVLGWYDGDAWAEGLRYMPSPTRRIADTRSTGDRRPVAPWEWRYVPATVLPPAAAHVLNVTATGGAGAGHLTTWDGWNGTGEPPETSTVNFARGEDSPNLTTVTSYGYGTGMVNGLTFMGTGVGVAVGTSPVHVVVDHLGYFY